MANIMDGPGLTSISELMKHYSLQEEAASELRPKNGQKSRQAGQHMAGVSSMVTRLGDISPLFIFVA
jgi:hypothetical protein